jgi:excisionase family DNA binding protein
VNAGPTISAAEAARRLRVSKSTVREWIDTNRLRAQRVGRGWAVEETSVAAMERRRPVDNPFAFAAFDRLGRRTGHDQGQRTGRR